MAGRAIVDAGGQSLPTGGDRFLESARPGVLKGTLLGSWNTLSFLISSLVLMTRPASATPSYPGAARSSISIDSHREIARALRFIVVLSIALHALLTLEESIRVPHLFPDLLAPKLLAAAISVAMLAILQTTFGVRRVVPVGLTSAIASIAPALWLAKLLNEPILIPIGTILVSLLSSAYVPWPTRYHAVIVSGGIGAILVDLVIRNGRLVLDPIAIVGVALSAGTLLLSLEAQRRRKRLRVALGELSESEQRFRQLAENSSDIIWIWSPSGQLEYVSPAYELYTGRSPDELYRDSRAVLDIVHPGDRRMFGRALELISRGRARTMELRLQDAEGATCYFEGRGTPIFDNRGNIKRCVGIWRDVTLRVKRSRELDLEAATDPLTGAHNRRFFREMAQKEISRSKRTRRPLSLVLIDIDHFKQVNDNHGHLAGDRVLAEVSRLGRDIVRGSDTFARFGGEEFVLLLPGADKSAAASVAETLRAGISAHRFEHGGVQLRVTISAGVATLDYRDGDSDLDSLIEKADGALYQAKEGGRNAVRTWRRYDSRSASEAPSARLDIPRLTSD